MTNNPILTQGEQWPDRVAENKFPAGSSDPEDYDKALNDFEHMVESEEHYKDHPEDDPKNKYKDE